MVLYVRVTFGLVLPQSFRTHSDRYENRKKPVLLHWRNIICVSYFSNIVYDSMSSSLLDTSDSVLSYFKNHPSVLPPLPLV
jgi:hypothetical protein